VRSAEPDLVQYQASSIGQAPDLWLQDYDGRTALLVVDVQNDFADPNGSLYVHGGEEILPVVDPEIGMNVVELALIKQIILGTDSSEVKMILTTPFCPYAGSMVQQVQEQAETVLEHPVKVTLLAERWDPRDAGLMW